MKRRQRDNGHILDKIQKQENDTYDETVEREK